MCDDHITCALYRSRW